MPQSMTEAKDAIIQHFDARRKSVFRPRELSTVLTEKREDWNLQEYVGPKRFTNFLISNGGLRQITLKSKKYGQQKLYIWGDVSPFEIAMSIRPGSYLSHGTAVFLHGISDQIPKLIYVNKEQSVKPRPQGGLSQDRLRFAFSRKQRESQYIFEWPTGKAILLNGKASDRLEVIDMDGPNGELLSVTGLERTLVDIVVRPTYAGGVFEIAEIYRNVKDMVSAEKLASILKSLDYVYPYHQAIGFLMERAGFDSKSLELMRKPGLDFDFYLQHGLKEPAYDASWRLFFPQGL